MSELQPSATAKVILGILRLGPRSGYDIKSFVDDSTAFFWSASYGRIYPELKRLEADGLVTRSSDPTGERRRSVYELTERGREAVARWLDAEPAPPVMRDEPLLQAFFALGPEQAARALDHKAEHALRKLERLQAIEPRAQQLDSPFPHLVLRFGKAFSEFTAEWCEREAKRLRADTGEAEAEGD